MEDATEGSASSAADADDENVAHVSAARRQQIQEDVLDLVAPFLVRALRFVLTEANTVKGFALVERFAELCGEDCRRDYLLPVVVSVTQSARPTVTPSMRAAALRALAVVASTMKTVPASECFVFEEYVVPAVVAAAKYGGKAPLVCLALAEAVPEVLRGAMHILELRQTLGRSYRSRLDYDSQRDYVVHRCWEVLRPLLNNLSSTSTVIIAALRKTEILLPCLGIEIASDGFVSMLSQLLGSPVVEVKREMYAAVLQLALYLRSPIAGSGDTIELMLDDALREKDARCVAIGLDAVRQILEARAMQSLDLTRLVQSATGLLAHPSERVSRAAARLFATAARVLPPTDVLVRIVPAVKSLLQHAVPLALLDRMDITALITPAAKLMHANERRRLQCCADYLRAYTNPDRINVPPSVTPRSLESVQTLDTLDISVRDAVWLVRALGLDSVASLAAHGRGEVRIPFLAKAPSTPWHMWQFAPTPRQLKRVLWQFKLHKRKVAASAKSKMRRGLNLKDAAASPVESGTGKSLTDVVSSLTKIRVPARPTGVPQALVRTAHEGGVTAMTTAKNWVLTAGRDNVVKLWDAADALRDTASPLLSPQPCKGIFEDAGAPSTILFAHFANSDDPNSIAAFGDSLGRMRLYDIGVSKAHTTTVNLADGKAGSLSACVSLNPKVLVVSTHRGDLLAVDTRTPSKEVWASHIPRNRGPISTMLTVSPDAPFGIACGTLRGYIAIFDMRFRAQLASTQLANSPAIYDMCSVASGGGDGAETPSIAVATSNNDVLRLNSKTFQETLALRPATPNSVRCMCSSGKGSALFTGGADGLLRHWNLAVPESSRTLYPPPARSCDYNFSRNALVVAETTTTAQTASTSAAMLAAERAARDDKATNHVDCVSKLACVTGPGNQHFLVSASRDGALCVWRNAPAPGAQAAA